ncbi:unannotated protein [freshwater metagenome]|jgi:hypothetical protein|uniref:Unannotated protein n=1 Tax=freshwater metagenome TaxID=449393 RepID=A0A6J6ECE9_9ZZZZ|nr:hypothetical protein [Actinomycetota bacterium]MTA19672.1 hypothetical protein [Actinomycetota bacterium]MTA88693.1 hypothetical protein [Actinomycetota bacterium]
MPAGTEALVLPDVDESSSVDTAEGEIAVAEDATATAPIARAVITTATETPRIDLTAAPFTTCPSTFDVGGL